MKLSVVCFFLSFFPSCATAALHPSSAPRPLAALSGWNMGSPERGVAALEWPDTRVPALNQVGRFTSRSWVWWPFPRNPSLHPSIICSAPNNPTQIFLPLFIFFYILSFLFVCGAIFFSSAYMIVFEHFHFLSGLGIRFKPPWSLCGVIYCVTRQTVLKLAWSNTWLEPISFNQILSHVEKQTDPEKPTAVLQFTLHATLC